VRLDHPFGQPPTQAVVESLASERVRIEGDDARHLAKVLRLAPGATCVATDGEGTIARLVLDAVDRRGIDARVVERAEVAPPALRFWLAADAAPARADWLVEKAVELGAWGFLPLAVPEPGRLERFRRLARAALKQSLGAWALRIRADLPAVEAARAGFFAGGWVGDPAGSDPLGEALPPAGDWVLVAGPPEGFSGPEEALWRGVPGVRGIALGARRLRAETAAVALLVTAALRIAESSQRD